MRNLDFAERRSREYQLRSLDTDQSSFGWVWDSAFAEWLSSSRPLFWLRGKPASGKSTLTQYLVSNDRTYSKLREYKNCEWLTIYFFFDFRGGKGMSNNFEGLLRSLLVQLLDSMPELKKYASSESSTHWHEAELRECLLLVFDHSSKGLCLFIDGLDEYEGNLLQLLRFLKKLDKIGEDPRTPRKIYVSSRPEPVPSELLEGTPSLSMSEENGRGIHAYIQSTIKGMPSKIAEDPQWKALCDGLVKRADGVFLWARFALDELIQGFCKGESIDELSERLQSVPDELEGIYKRIVNRMEPQARNEAFVMLQIACSTLVDLFLQDFLVATNFTMETDLSIRSFIGCSELQMFSRRVRAKVGGLLEIVEVKKDSDGDEDDGGEDDGDEDDGDEDRTQNTQDGSNEDIDDNGIEGREVLMPKSLVKLTHKTIKTFLDKCGWQLLQPQRQILPCDGDLLLLKACSKYLKQFLNSFQCYDNEAPVAKYVLKKANSTTIYPLLSYSACTLFHHAQWLETVGNVSSYVYIKEVLTPKFGTVHLALVDPSNCYSTCLCIYGSIRKRYPYNVTSPFVHGLPKTCEEIICTYADDDNFSLDEALNEAILSTGVHFYEAYYLDYISKIIPLVLAKITQIKQSHLERAMAIPRPVDVLRLLLAHQSFQNLQIFTDDGRRATFFWVFIHSKKNYINRESLYANLKFIIERGEDVNEPCGPDGTALDYAVRREDGFVTADIIKALVRCGAYKTLNPDSFSKPIKLFNGSPRFRRTTLRAYLAGEAGVDLGLTKAQKDTIEKYLAETAVTPCEIPSNSGEGRTDD